MYIDSKTVIAMEYFMRNYDLEWEFIRNMDKLAEYWLHDPVIVNGENPQCVGLYIFAPDEASNDNSFGAV